MREVTRRYPLISKLDWRGTNAWTWQLLGLWLALRLFTSLFAALVAFTTRMVEHVERLTPPSVQFWAWVDHVLLAPWQRWDTNYYIQIVQHGYSADDGTAQFHPLFTWLATPLAWSSGQPLLGLMIVSSLASVLLLLAFERLARLDQEPASARTSSLLFFCSPPAFVLFAAYTESLFLLWAVLCFFWARQRSWWLAGLAGGLATLTRQQGIFLALPLACELWEAGGRRWRAALAQWRDWAALLLIPVALLIWLLYRAVLLSDLTPNFSNPQALIYSVLVSPSASQVVPKQALLWPPQAFSLALLKFWHAPNLSVMVDLTLGIVFVGLLLTAWANMRTSYRIYTVAITLVSFGYHTGPFFPYMGLPRHLLLAFPVFIGLGSVFRRPSKVGFPVSAGLLGMLFLVFIFEIEAWVP